jgi:hypothetical protein
VGDFVSQREPQALRGPSRVVLNDHLAGSACWHGPGIWQLLLGDDGYPKDPGQVEWVERRPCPAILRRVEHERFRRFLDRLNRITATRKEEHRLVRPV